MSTLFEQLPKLFLIMLACNVAHTAHSAPHQLRERGRTLIEAENYSPSNREFPQAEACRNCSGRKTLGFLWKNAWFDMEVEATRASNFSITMRTSSLAGTKIEVYSVDPSGEVTSLAAINAPKTGDWYEYTNTDEVNIFLTAGVHVLRYKNMEKEAANVDYITFTPGAVRVARPAVSDGPPINPLKGFNSSWWRNEDFASVGFQYLEWKDLEPKDDVFDWDAVEKVLDREGTQGRHFILQFVVDWDGDKPLEANYRGPAWLRKKVKEHRGNEDPDDPASRQMRATDYNDPVFIEEATEAIRALLDHYRDDPRTFVIQVGVLGFWAEWHTYPRVDWNPTDETKSTILDAYLTNLGPDGLTQIRYPKEAVAQPRQGMGYTNGSATLTDHGREFGKAIAEGDLWKNGPVGGEWPPNVEPEYWKRFFLTNEGEDYIKEAHYSTLCPPEPKEIARVLPGWKQDERFMQMHRRMGYNFQVKEVRHIATRNDTGQACVEVDLHNAGIAPFYKDWDVQLAIINAETANPVETIDVETDLRDLGPGQSVTLALLTSKEFDLQTHEIGIRIFQPGANKTKTTRWKLNARNTYVVLSNDLKVIDGEWGKKSNALQGGWNILGNVDDRPQAPRSKFFPFEGSFRTVGGKE